MPQDVHFCIGRDPNYQTLFVFIVRHYGMYFRTCLPIDCKSELTLPEIYRQTKPIWSKEK